MTERPVYVYKLAIEYPPGSTEPGWEPPGYQSETVMTPDGFEDREFSWPHERAYLSREGAIQRAGILRGWGANVGILRSERVTWAKAATA